MKYILASGSPRRRELLKKIVSEYEVRPSSADESYLEGTPPEEVCVTLARRKAEAIKYPADTVVIGADTIVYLDGKIYNKPVDRKDAELILSTICGRTHTVYTGVAVILDGSIMSGYAKTAVTIGAITKENLAHYIDNCNPYDKAGGYGIQDLNKYVGITYEGSYHNIVGLPLELTDSLIRQIVDIQEKKWQQSN